ncbi:hypothetical protein DF196_06060 [Bifidobacterium callitrichidarum]|uniref:Glycosyltransferase RgtA/B/C/D-like domain-containing protein n=1 Tax=Bifidobacterium callitrichidarum TaxID=2052941 RepID=A0A2U2N9W7_9BIFI|nr:hypothetical protein DF196_06060 [Bifidobacterium callitrichidarum]
MRTKISALAETIAYALTVIALTVIALVSLFTTSIFQPAQGASSDTVLAEQMTFRGSSALLIAGVPIFVAAIAYASRLMARFSDRGRFVVLIAYVLIMQVTWIGALNFANPQYPDSVMLSRGATELVRGNIAAFSPDYCAPEGALGYQATCAGQDQLMKGNLFNYLAWYPFQSGAMLWFALIYRLFGTQNFMAFQFINALSVTGVVVVLCRFAQLLGLGRKAKVILELLIALCFPLLMFSAFVYTNAVGLLLTLLAALLLIECLRVEHVHARIFLLVGSCVAAALGVMVKNTFNILVLAMLIVLVLATFQSRRWWLLAGGIVGYSLVLKSTVVPVLVMEHVTGQSFGPGMPALSWIAMGVQHKTGVLPGWWQSDALNVYLSTGGDYAAQYRHAVDTIRAAWSSSVNDPLSALVFFGQKLSTEWAEPTFETVLYSGLGIRMHAGNGLAHWLLSEPGRSVVNAYGDVMQSAVYLCALIAVVAMVAVSVLHTSKERDSVNGEILARKATMLFLAVGFLGGFCCYLLWEAKSIYTLPFYALLLPFAAQGFSMLFDCMRKPVARCLNRHRTNATD